MEKYVHLSCTRLGLVRVYVGNSFRILVYVWSEVGNMPIGILQNWVVFGFKLVCQLQFDKVGSCLGINWNYKLLSFTKLYCVGV